MSRDGPLVSVLMATYNSEPFLAETIETVLAQTYPNVELIAADDASTDGTPGILADYAARWPARVRPIYGSDRRGPCRRRNDALDAARGELLAWLDHDDLWLPNKLSQQVRLLLDKPEVGLVYTGYEAFDSETGAVLGWREEELEAEGDILGQLFVEGCFIASLTVMFRREALTKRGLRFRERDFSFGDDYYLWLAIALDWRVERIDDVLARYRRHAANESARLGERNYHLARIALLREFLADFPDAEERLGRLKRAGFAVHYLYAALFERSRRRYGRAALYGLRALAFDPREAVRRLAQA